MQTNHAENSDKRRGRADYQRGDFAGKQKQARGGFRLPPPPSVTITNGRRMRSDRMPVASSPLEPTLLAGLLADLAEVTAADEAGRAAALCALQRPETVESILGAQLLLAHHQVIACVRLALQSDPTGAEASRLRRDSIAWQRSLAGMARALWAGRPRAAGHAAASASLAADRHAQQAADPWADHPDLQRLGAQWHNLPDWNAMTPEQRRATWGYRGSNPPGE